MLAALLLAFQVVSCAGSATTDRKGLAHVEKHVPDTESIPPASSRSGLMRSEEGSAQAATDIQPVNDLGIQHVRMPSMIDNEDDADQSEVSPQIQYIQYLDDQLRTLNQKLQEQTKNLPASKLLETPDAAALPQEDEAIEETVDEATLSTVEGWRRRRRRRRVGPPGLAGNRGSPGASGDAGPKGDKGLKGKQGPPGKEGKCSFLELDDEDEKEKAALAQDAIQEVSINELQQKIAALNDMYDTLADDDDLGVEEQCIKGRPGPKGTRGPHGRKGAPGPRGDPGDRGKAGPPGKSGKCSFLEIDEEEEVKKGRSEKEKRELSRLSSDVESIKSSLVSLTATAERVALGCRGNKGPPGDAGGKGPRGSKGARGPPGAAGPTGPPGKNVKKPTTTVAATTAAAKSGARSLQATKAGAVAIALALVKAFA